MARPTTIFTATKIPDNSKWSVFQPFSHESAMRENIIREELNAQDLEVIDIMEDPMGLRLNVEFDGNERSLRARLPDHYDVDSVVESDGKTTAVLRHSL